MKILKKLENSDLKLLVPSGVALAVLLGFVVLFRLAAIKFIIPLGLICCFTYLVYVIYLSLTEKEETGNEQENNK